MRLLERIWADVRHGENIDLYATVVIAFGLVALSLVGIAPPGLVASLTLAVLGLLAVTNLVNRYRIEALSRQMRQTSGVTFTDEWPPELKERLQAGKDVWLVGVMLSGLLKNNYQMLEEELAQGHTVRALLVHPEGAPVEMAASRYYAPVRRDVQTVSAQIRDSLNLCSELRKTAPDRFQVRTIHNPLTYGAICVNPDGADGVIYIEHYPYRTVTEGLPKVALRASDGRWYEFFKKEVRALWQHGVEWPAQAA